MSYFETRVARELVKKLPEDRKPRSETSYRLYWSTFLRSVTHKSPKPYSRSQVWKFFCQQISSIQRWWTKRVPSDIRVGESKSRAHPRTSEQGDI